MLESSYRQAITHAWKLVWHNKILWIFGLLAAFAGQFGMNNFIGRLVFLSGSHPSVRDYLAMFYFNFARGGTVWLIWLFFLAALVIISIVFLAVASRGALVAAAAAWYKNKTTPDFEKSWHKGVKHFWRLLFLDILKRIALGLILLALVIVWNNGNISTMNLALSVLIVFVSLLVALAVSVSAVYAAGYLVEEGAGFVEAIARGWRLFTKHFLVSVELSVLLVALDVLVVAVLMIVSTVALVPTVIFTMFAGITGFSWLIVCGLATSLVLSVIMVALIGAIYNAFTISAWIYLFMKMHHEGIGSRLLHYVRKVLIKG